jgi:hypothetical protein
VSFKVLFSAQDERSELGSEGSVNFNEHSPRHELSFLQ